MVNMDLDPNWIQQFLRMFRAKQTWHPATGTLKQMVFNDDLMVFNGDLLVIEW